MAFNLKKVVRALLFSTSQPLAIRDFQSVFTRFHERAPDAPAPATAGGSAPEPAGSAAENEETIEMPLDPELYEDVPSLVTAAQLREVLEELGAQFEASDEGLILVEGATGYRLATHPRFARWVRVLRAEPPPMKLSMSALETLAVVAYRQPATRGEIEAIRGVSADAGINRLLERELIHVTGRAELPGRPLQYGTTERFLELTGLKSLDELPASDVLSPRQLEDWLQRAMNPTRPGDADMGLPDENPSGPDPAASNAESKDAAPGVAQG